jgi:hypothetical protein
MSKKNKIVYSNVQPNAKEAGIWVNTTDGNVMVEKDGKWVDDNGEGSASSDYMWYLSAEEHKKIESSGLRENLYYAKTVIKYISTDDNVEIVSSGINASVKTELAAGIIMTLPIQFNYNGKTFHNFKEYLEFLGYDLSNVKWMTKEEFYNLEA